MPITSYCGVDPSCLRTRSFPFLADDAWSCTCLESPREIVCFRPQKSQLAIRGQPLCMPMGAPRWVWKDPFPRLQLKGGFLWRLLCLAPKLNRPCGPVLDSAQWQEQPSILGRCLPSSQKGGRNYSCSRAGNSGIQLGSQVLPCPNGWLELMWAMDRMDATPLPF